MVVNPHLSPPLEPFSSCLLGHHSVRTAALAALAALGLAIGAPAATLTTFDHAVSSSWTWEGGDAQIAWNVAHNGELTTGLAPTAGTPGVSLTRVSGPAQLDPGVQTHYPIPAGYNGAWGLYNDDGSLYTAYLGPHGPSVLSGTATASNLADIAAWAEGRADAQIGSFSRFAISFDTLMLDIDTLVFEIAIHGFGPTEANHAAGTVTSFQVTQAITPVSLTLDGETFLPEATLLSYQNDGSTGRHAYASGGAEEVWRFTWDAAALPAGATDGVIAFGNYPTSVISGLQVSQVTAVPEPSGVLLGLMATGVWGVRRRRKAPAHVNNGTDVFASSTGRSATPVR